MRSEKWPADWQVRLIQLLAIPGLIIAFYLLLYHNGNLVSVCRRLCDDLSGDLAEGLVAVTR
jgi:hypothetical protein